MFGSRRRGRACRLARSRAFATCLAIPCYLALTSACGGEPRVLTPEERALLGEVGLGEPAVVAAIEGVGGPVARFQSLTDEGVPAPAPGVTVEVRSQLVGDALVELRAALQGRGVGAYHAERNYGFEPDRIAVVVGDDPYAFLTMVRVDGINRGLEHEHVITRLRAWDARYELDYVGAGLDWVQANLGRVPGSWERFAEEVYAFCPDVVDQGTGTVQSLADEMRRTRSVYCWWD